MKTPQGMDAKAMAAGYKIALTDISGGVVEKAMTDVIAGNAPNCSAVFLPTPAELAQYAREIIQATQYAIKYAKRLLEASEVAPPRRLGQDKIATLIDTMGNTPTSQMKH